MIKKDFKFCSSLNYIEILIIFILFFSTSLLGATKPLKKIQFGYNAGSISSPFIVIADQAGLFKQEGLDVELLNLGSEGPNAVNQGKVYGYPFGTAGLQWAAKNGNVIFFGGTRNEGSVYMAKPEIAKQLKNLKNFKGKKIGAPRLNSATYHVLEKLQEVGLNTKKDIEYVELDSFPIIIEALVKGNVDVGVIGTEQIQNAKKRGLEIVFQVGDLSPGFVCCKQIGNKKLIAENRDDYVALMRAEIQAYKIFLEDKEKTIKYLIEYSGQSREFIENVYYDPENSKHNIITPDPYKNKIVSYYNLLASEGILPKGVNIANYIDTTIYRDALNQLVKKYPKDVLYKKLLTNYPKNNL